MVLMKILILSLILGVVLIILGFYFKKKALLASLSGGIILAILGISLLGGGISYVSGLNETVISANNTITTDVYSIVNDANVNIFSWSVFIIGFAGFVGSVMALNNSRFETDELDDDIPEY